MDYPVQSEGSGLDIVPVQSEKSGLDIVENPKKEKIFKKKKEDFLDSKKKHSRKIANAKHYKKKSMAKSRIVKTQKLSLQDSSAQDNTNYAQRSGSTLVAFTRGTFLNIGAM